MAGAEHLTVAFDFSRDAEKFKAHLWEKLKAEMAAPTITPLEDDDLEWVSAAGMSARPEEEKTFR